MYDNNASYELLELALPGAWIAQHRRIWQMNFLNAGELGNFGHKRGLASYNEKEIIQLWQLGLIKADFITSTRKIRLVGLVHQGTDRYGNHLYSDERQLPRHLRAWGNARTKVKPIQEGVKLLFHPFRYYILYHLDSVLGLHISKMQMLYQEGFPRVLEWSLSSFNHRSKSEQFRASIRKWNDIASLCVLTEPCIYYRIFQTIRYSIFDVESDKTGKKEILQDISEYRNTSVKSLYSRIGIERLETIRQDLCFDIRMLDENEWVHTLLCLGDPNHRLELEGHLGGALVLRTMTEMLRRMMEEVFNKELPEEDEWGASSVPHGFKKKLYGSNRILDNSQAGGNYARRHGLNYKPRVHLYVEGDTEYGALKSFFKIMGISVPMVNLHGFIKANKKQDQTMVRFFGDSLQSDIGDQMYSLVIIDDDVCENVKILESAAKNNNASKDKGMFGRFFLSHTDFEFANFEIEELEEILWTWLGGESPSQADRELLHTYVQGTSKSTPFFNKVKSFAAQHFPRLTGYDKSEEWGERLMEFALEQQLKQNQKRQIIEIIETIMYWETTIHLETYNEAIQKYTVNPKNGELIQRSS